MPEQVHVRRPAPILRPYIECLWYYSVDKEPPGPDLLLPHGAFELVISLGGSSDASLISGPHSKAMIVDPGASSPLVGAHFRPGGAAALFGYPASDFLDLDVPLVDVWGRQTHALIGAISTTSGPEATLQALERELTRYTTDAPTRHPAVSLAISQMHGSGPLRRMRDLVEETGVSQRRFIELFTEWIGMPPKRYARIQRFQRILSQASRLNTVDWSALAYEYGYSDQAHLIRDFREFSGLTPTEYAPRWPDQPNHVPLSRSGSP